MAFAGFDAPDNNIFEFLLNDLPLFRADKFRELFHCPHAFVDFIVFAVLCDRVISEMHVAVVYVIQREIVSAESDVALIVEPYFGGAEVLDQNPLSDIEFLSFDY